MDRKSKKNIAGFSKKTEAAITLYVLTIRDMLMLYYKGSGLHTPSSGRRTNLHIRQRIDSDMVGHRYQRTRAEMQNLKALTLDMGMLVREEITLVKLQRSPHKLFLMEKTWSRSPELRRIRSDMLAFMDTYLKGVEIVSLDEGNNDGHLDNEIISSVRTVPAGEDVMFRAPSLADFPF